jgi:sugar O-acyltransferase (sialic acid O-acetyltransferase NeuD family)
MRTDVPTVLVGAGGHGKVVFDAIEGSLGGQTRLIVVDDDPAMIGSEFFGLQVQHGTACRQWRDFFFHVAIGRNERRRNIFERLRRDGGSPLTVVHPRAQLSRHARVGEGSFLAAGCLLGPAAIVAEGVIVNHTAVVDHDCQVGAFTHIAPNATLGGGVRVGSSVLVGAGAVVLPGVSVGDGAIIGAGTVVIADVRPSVTVVGLPGREVMRGIRP